MLGPLAGRVVLDAYKGWQRGRDKAFSVLVGKTMAGFGPRSVLQLPVRIEGSAGITVGSDVFVGAGSWLQTLPGVSPAPDLVIGDGTSIAGSCVLSAARSVRLGRQVLLARNVYISDHIHAYRDRDLAVLLQGIDKILPVVVEDGAWLGQNVVVTPGVRIGRGAVVAANAVVNADVPAWSLAAGVPAQLVRSWAPDR
ncbi:MAG: acyltransferase [Acidimicrobiales bacterium]